MKSRCSVIDVVIIIIIIERLRAFRRTNQREGCTVMMTMMKPSGGCLSPLAETAVVICPRRHMAQKSTTSHL
jgi:hypothetical protein